MFARPAVIIAADTSRAEATRGAQIKLYGLVNMAVGAGGHRPLTERATPKLRRALSNRHLRQVNAAGMPYAAPSLIRIHYS